MALDTVPALARVSLAKPLRHTVMLTFGMLA
jgi:hypothetical protein